jgi:Prokaryotic Cytochrome C oxidase subunit IV
VSLRSPLRPERATLVWWVLLAATALNWELSEWTHSPRGARAVLLLVAFFKGRLVLLHFMQVSHERLVVRLVMEGWLALTCGALILQLCRALQS